MDLKKLISDMTFEEKVGQLAQYNADVVTDVGGEITGPLVSLGLAREDIPKVGSVLNCHDVENMLKIQREHLENDRNKIPIVFMIDVIHGYRTIFPIPLALGCSFDEEIAAECSRMAAKEASANGVQVTFAPMVDYVRDARWGRVMETSGEEPLLNARIGAACVRAFQGDDMKDPDHIGACVKHFAGYGGAEAGRDYNTVDVDERTLREFYLPAYKACIDAGAKLLMPSFNSLGGIPSVANKRLMNKLLRDEWGYDGVVISDYNAIGELCVHGVAADKKEAARLAFGAGCDIEMCSSAYYHHMKELVDEGVFSIEDIDAAVLRVLKFKQELGLFDDPYRGASKERAEAVVLTPEHRDIAKRAALASAVLLKNDNNILPFSDKLKRIALIGPFADEKRILGSWCCCGRKEDSVTVREGVAAILPDAEITCVTGCSGKIGDTDRSGFEEAVAAAKGADAVVLCLGESMDYSGEGNCRTDLRLPGVQEELARAVAEANPNTAALLFNGRPIVIKELSGSVGAILEMWFPGTEGGSAAADLLFGRANPEGKLTMSFPASVGQCPIYYNHPNTGRPKPQHADNVPIRYISGYLDCGNLPLYSFGHGLSYSRFVYEDMTLDSTELSSDGKIRVGITLYNDSCREGRETVQLYIRDKAASVVRPVAQLIDYKKVTLLPYERKTVELEIREEMLRFWNFECEHVSEPGEFSVMTGYADHFVHQKAFTLK